MFHDALARLIPPPAFVTPAVRIVCVAVGSGGVRVCRKAPTIRPKGSRFEGT